MSLFLPEQPSLNNNAGRWVTVIAVAVLLGSCDDSNTEPANANGGSETKEKQEVVDTVKQQPSSMYELLPLGTGADLDPALQKRCDPTAVSLKDERGKGGDGELPRGAFKKFTCSAAEVEVEWTMAVDGPHDGSVFMLSLSGPMKSLRGSASDYLSTLSPPAAKKRWKGAISAFFNKPEMTVVRSGDRKLFMSPVMAGGKRGDGMFMLTASKPNAEELEAIERAEEEEEQRQWALRKASQILRSRGEVAGRPRKSIISMEETPKGKVFVVRMSFSRTINYCIAFRRDADTGKLFYRKKYSVVKCSAGLSRIKKLNSALYQ